MDGGGIGFVTAGDNQTRVFGLPPALRARRFAAAAGLAPLDDIPADRAAIVADLGHAWDPAWLRHLRDHPRLAVTRGGRVVLVHAAAGEAPTVAAALVEGRALPPGYAEQRVEDGSSLYNATLRKREDAFLMPLTPATAAAVERASYDASYKGVTDLLTLYLWRGAAFHLTRAAAALRLSPNAVTLVGIALCVWTFFLFMAGHYATGLAIGLIFMVLDTVDGKLARCTGTSSAWGNALDHGVDLVHPLFWYWAWGHGLAARGLSFSHDTLWTIMAVLAAGYVVQRLIEGAFIAAFAMHIHVWRRADSRFRLVTARRNPNMVILFASVIVARPDTGLVAVAWWTALCCLFHLVRLGQAWARRARGGEIVSWLA